MAREYQLVIAREPDVGYLGRTIEMGLVMGDGPTIEACAASTLEATALSIASMLDDGERPPSPARAEVRDQQVNIRISADEKLRLTQTANREGYRSLSDYMRDSALRRVS